MILYIAHLGQLKRPCCTWRKWRPLPPSLSLSPPLHMQHAKIETFSLACSQSGPSAPSSTSQSVCPASFSLSLLRYVNDNVKRDAATSKRRKRRRVVLFFLPFCSLTALTVFCRSIPSAIRRRTCEAREAVVSTPSNFILFSIVF